MGYTYSQGEAIRLTHQEDPKMKLYIYSLEDNSHIATINGDSNEACEAKAKETYGYNEYGWTYSLVGLTDENDEAEEIEL